MTIENKKKTIKAPSFIDALIPIITLVIFLAGALLLFGDEAITGPIQVALTLTTMVAAVVGLKNGLRMEEIGKAAVDGISSAMGAIFILLAVGALVGTWSMAGTIATLVHFGVQFLNPNWYYLACAIVCSILALSIGSAWTVAGTLGVGLIGISTALGVSPEITAGAVISGAYFGDKMSPLSETTNLAPAVAGTDLYTHIKNMMWTSIPSILISLVIFGFLGYSGTSRAPIDLSIVLRTLEDVFNISILTLIPLLVVIVLSLLRIPAFSTILIGALTGGLMAVILQPHRVIAFVGDPSLSAGLAMIKGVWSAMATGFSLETNYPVVNSLFSRGGMSSMLETVWLIISAMAFGGVMEYTGLLARLIQPLLKVVKSDRGLLLGVGMTSIGINIIAGDQYMAIVLPGRMYRETFDEKSLAPQMLSRQIEDTGTITSPLVPWNSCGAYMSATLGVATIAYFPFCFFNWINVIVSFAYDLIGFKIIKLPKEEGVTPSLKEATYYGVSGQSVVPNELEQVVESGNLRTTGDIPQA